MNRYHIAYRPDKADPRIKGENYDAVSMTHAIKAFNNKHKGIEPEYIDNKGKVKDQRFK